MIKGPRLLRWVPDYEGIYLAHRDGQIWNQRAHVMATGLDRYGYVTVRLTRDGKQRHHKLHSIMCRVWHGLPPSPKHEVCHRDGNKANNSAENLRWGTRSENVADSIKHGTFFGAGRPSGEKHPRVKLSARQVSELRALGGKMSQRALAKQFAISQTQVCHILQRKRWA